MSDLDPIIESGQGHRGDLFDAANGMALIKWARWANLATGEYVAFAIDPKKAERLKIAPEDCTRRGRTRLVWVDREEPVGSPLAEGATRREHEKVLILPGDQCEHYACARIPEWRVADVCDGIPEVGPNGQRFATTVLVAVHRYCSWHYRLPRTVNAKDHRETVRVLEAHLAQPGA